MFEAHHIMLHIHVYLLTLYLKLGAVIMLSVNVAVVVVLHKTPLYETLSVFQHVFLSVFLSFCLSVFLPFFLSVFLSFCLSIFLSFYLSVFLSVFLSIPIYLFSYCAVTKMLNNRRHFFFKFYQFIITLNSSYYIYIYKMIFASMKDDCSCLEWD